MRAFWQSKSEGRWVTIPRSHSTNSTCAFLKAHSRGVVFLWSVACSTRNEKDVGRKERRERSREEEGEMERERDKCRNGHIEYEYMHIINNLLMYMYNKQLCYSTMMP